jgi:hypothetical protein
MTDHPETSLADDLRDAWKNLASFGTPPASEIAARVLPSWSVGLDGWLDRLTKEYLRDYCRRNSHFKLALAGYGGGKTHFLLSLAARAIEENWATCYLQCKQNVSLADWYGLYQFVANSIQLPGTKNRRGIKLIFQAALEQMRKRAAGAPEPEYAIDKMVAALEDEDWPHSSFATVAAALLNHLRDPRTDPTTGEAALRWLRGQPDTLTAKERQSLHLGTLTAKGKALHGQTLFYSLVKFMPRAGVNGLALLFDEMDSMMNVRGKALEQIFVSMRVLLDAPDQRMDRLPLFGVFAAVPDIQQLMQKAQFLASRFKVVLPFHQGDDNAPVLDLSEIGSGSQNEMLRAMGEKLLQLGIQVHDWKLNLELQRKNLKNLAEVTAKRRLEVNARRLFVKTWCSLLEDQSRNGETEKTESELSNLIEGIYSRFRQVEATPTTNDLG